MVVVPASRVDGDGKEAGKERGKDGAGWLAGSWLAAVSGKQEGNGERQKRAHTLWNIFCSPRSIRRQWSLRGGGGGGVVARLQRPEVARSDDETGSGRRSSYEITTSSSSRPHREDMESYDDLNAYRRIASQKHSTCTTKYTMESDTHKKWFVVILRYTSGTLKQQ